jgi:chromosome condensin MukBEF ATPase and DNA-binding subunit MukB
MMIVGKKPQGIPGRMQLEHKELARQHAKLQQEFEKLKSDRFNADAHSSYLRQLKVHLAALEKHSAELDEQREIHREQRGTLHAQHEATAKHPAPTPKKRRQRR